MLTVNHLSINFDGENLFSDVNLKFTKKTNKILPVL